MRFKVTTAAEQYQKLDFSNDESPMPPFARRIDELRKDK